MFSDSWHSRSLRSLSPVGSFAQALADPAAAVRPGRGRQPAAELRGPANGSGLAFNRDAPHEPTLRAQLIQATAVENRRGKRRGASMDGAPVTGNAAVDAGTGR